MRYSKKNQYFAKKIWNARSQNFITKHGLELGHSIWQLKTINTYKWKKYYLRFLHFCSFNQVYWLRKMDLVIKLIRLMMKERKIHRLKMTILNLQKLKGSLAYHPNWLILLQISGSMKLTGLIFKLMIRITGNNILNTWKSQQ